MNSRERILKAINHEEPDRIPFDLAGSTWTGITNTAYQNLRKHLSKREKAPEWSDVIQQIVIPSEDILDKLQVDTRGVFPLTSHNWDVYSKLKDRGDYWEYFDEWSFVHHFPKNGYWFSLVKSPLEEINFENGDLIEELRSRGKTTFLVTNGLFPKRLKELKDKNQLPTRGQLWENQT